MSTSRRLDRRTFVADLGRGAFALAVLGIAGCAPGSPATARPSAPSASEPPGGAVASPGTSGTAGAPPSSPPGSLRWSRVNLGFVSAYVLVRAGEAAVVDTGVEGSAGAIEDALSAVGLGWPAVRHLVLTHHHVDHVGSVGVVLGRAPEAVGYAGAEDIGAIDVPRPLVPVADGDRVFGLQIVTAPGHTAGSICVLDAEAGLLVAGDALRSVDGRPALPDPGFSDDMDEALASVAKLGALTFETLLVGHGDPVEGGASAAVAELAAQP